MLELCQVHAIPEGDSRGFELEGRRLFAIKKNMQCYVYENRCPHQGIQLNWMEHQFLDRSKTYLQCSTHGALFEPETGLCIEGPCLGAHLKQVDSEQKDGKLYVYL